MGADARWVCNTCETVCSRGGSPVYLATGLDMSMQSISGLKVSLGTLSAVMEIADSKRVIAFLDDLSVWLARHAEHSIHVGSDYTTDGADLDDYHNEDVDGKVSSMTRHEIDMSCFDEWTESSIRDIQQTIEEFVENKSGKSSREVAEGLFNQYGMRV